MNLLLFVVETELIHSCYTKDGVVRIKKSEHGKAITFHHINSLYEQFPEFVF